MMRTIVVLLGIRSAAACNGDLCETYGPKTMADQASWLEKLKDNRQHWQRKVGWEGGVFDKVSWTSTSYIQPQMHPYDRYFFDPTTGEYTVDRYLQDLEDRYGGIDSLLLWPTYTNIGVDDRNQFDYFRAMPGGLDGVKNITAQLKAKGVRVLWPYNPWDVGTRRESLSDEDTFATLLPQTGGDGFNGDTMDYVPESFWTAALKQDYPLAFEPEGGGSEEALKWTTQGWGYWDWDSDRPVVDRFKFLTGGRFLTHACDRWNKDKKRNLRPAWFNGDGYESWENVWGVWNGITPYDAEAIRRVAAMLRHFGGKGFLQSPDWEPYSKAAFQIGVYASKFPLSNRNQTLWTLVSYNREDITARLQVEPAKYYYDCYGGQELKASKTPAPEPSAPMSEDYTAHHERNCYTGHGGEDIDGDVIAEGITQAQCMSHCDSAEVCMCVTYQVGSGRCWRRANCEPQSFEADGSYAVFVKRSGFSHYLNRNAWAGHGADEIDTDVTAPDGLSQQECEARCFDDEECECVTQELSTGKCWKRKTCATANFDNNHGFSVYVNRARGPDVLPVPPPGAHIAFPLEAEGYGCILQSDTEADGTLTQFLSTMQKMTAKPLSSFDAEWKFLKQTMVEIPSTKSAATPPNGMVLVPRADTFEFSVSDVALEPGIDSPGVDVQYPWEDHPQNHHNRTMSVDAFFIDKFPVTNQNYSDYLQASGYTPADPYNWLLSWKGAKTPPPQILDQPVTYVGLDEARQYCAWRGARLPHSWEWQYAAQGTDGRLYPWGSKKISSNYPRPTTGNTFPGPESVTAHAPAGDSIFGVSDLVGNVWQYTDEFQDEHTRAVILRGGSNYRPSGSDWYFPQALELHKHERYFLFNDRYERAGTVGFRCVVDADTDTVIAI